MRRCLIQMAAAAALLVAAGAASAQSVRLRSDPEPTARCITQAAQAFGVSELPLWVILDVERGSLGRVSMNSNGTYDIGPMQINSIWLKRLAKYGVTEDGIKNNLCMNIHVATWIFTKELREHGTLVKAIANYHSPTPKYQIRYLGLIQRALDRRIRQLQQEQALASNG